MHVWNVSVYIYKYIQGVRTCSRVRYVDLCSVRYNEMRNHGSAARYNGMRKARCSVPSTLWTTIIARHKAGCSFCNIWRCVGMSSAAWGMHVCSMHVYVAMGVPAYAGTRYVCVYVFAYMHAHAFVYECAPEYPMYFCPLHPPQCS